MASLPLFCPSSSFMPNSSASSFAPRRTTHARPVDPPTSAAWARSRATMRSLFDPMPPMPPTSPTLPTRVAPHPDPVPTARAASLQPTIDDGTARRLTTSDPSHTQTFVEPRVTAPTSLERTEVALRAAGLAGQFWRGDALSTSPLPSMPSGFRALDEELPGGGWPSRCLTELLLSHTGVGEIRFLASTLSSLTRAGREIVLLAPPHVPDPTGWEQLGIDMRRVLIVRTERPADRLWAIEQSLKSSAFGALLAWLPEEKALARQDALRRLQSLAASANGLSFLMRPAAAQYHASPASLRLTLSIGKPEGTRRTLSVRLIKRRGPVLAKPLTLMPPEVHRGMKAFGLEAATTAGARSATPKSLAPKSEGTHSSAVKSLLMQSSNAESASSSSISNPVSIKDPIDFLRTRENGKPASGNPASSCVANSLITTVPPASRLSGNDETEIVAKSTIARQRPAEPTTPPPPHSSHALAGSLLSDAVA